MAENETPDVVTSGETTATVERVMPRRQTAREIQSQVESQIQSLQPTSLTDENASDQETQAHAQQEQQKETSRGAFAQKTREEFADKKILAAQELRQLQASEQVSTEAQDALVSTVTLITAAAHDMAGVVSPTSKVVLNAIHEKVVSTMTKEAAVATYGLIESLVEGEPTIDALRNHFNQIKETYGVEQYLTNLSDAIVGVKGEIGLGSVEDDFLREHYFNPQTRVESGEGGKNRQDQLLEKIDALQFTRPSNYAQLDDEGRSVYDQVAGEIAEQRQEIIQSVVGDYAVSNLQAAQLFDEGPRADRGQKQELLEKTKDVLALVKNGHIPLNADSIELLDRIQGVGKGISQDEALRLYPLILATVNDDLRGTTVITHFDMLIDREVSPAVLKTLSELFITKREQFGLGEMTEVDAKQVFDSGRKKTSVREKQSIQEKIESKKADVVQKMAHAVNPDGSVNEDERQQIAYDIIEDLHSVSQYAEFVREADPQTAANFSENESIRDSLVAWLEVAKNHPEYLTTLDAVALGEDTNIKALVPAIEKLMSEAAVYPHLAVQMYANLHSFVQELSSAGVMNLNVLTDAAKSMKNAQLVCNPVAHGMVEQMFSDMNEVVRSGVFGTTIEASAAEKVLKLRDQKSYEAQVVRSREFESDWQHYYRSYYGPDQNLQDIVKAIYSVEDFEDYYGNIQRDMLGATFNKRDLASLTTEEALELRSKVSEKIEADIIAMYSGLFQVFDYKRPTEFFENQMSEGYMDSIANTKIRIDKVLGQLVSSINRDGLDDSSPLKDAMFFKRFTEQELFEVEVEKTQSDLEQERKLKAARGDTSPVLNKKSVMQYRVMPTAGYKDQVGLAEFVNYTKASGETMVDIRGFNHNVQAILLTGGGGKSPWESLKGYAEKMKGSDIDSIWLLPDAEIWKEANAIYIRLLRYEFAKLDYKHSSTLFSPDNEQRTKVQQAAEEELKRAFPDLAEGKNQARLKLAISMGVGLSQGVLLNEVELAAYADPVLDPKENKATYRSYYYNDNSMLAPLNDVHNKARWQSDREQALWHLLVTTDTDEAKRLMKRFDHSVLYAQREEFYDSFRVGEERLNKYGKTLMDRMPNYAKVGGWATRATSWRMESALEGAIIKEQGTDKVDWQASWRAVENIGVEPLKWFAINSGFKLPRIASKEYAELKRYQMSEKGEAKIGEEMDKISATVSERDEFFKNLFQKYIAPSQIPEVDKNGVVVESSLLTYDKVISQLLKKEREDYDKNPDVVRLEKKMRRSPKEEEELLEKRAAITENANLAYLNLVCGYARWQRDPTTIINFERDRFSKDGVRAMEKIRRRLSDKAAADPEYEAWKDEKGDLSTMDRAMKNLVVVSSVVRKETSDSMKETLRQQSIADKPMNLAETQLEHEYRVDDESIVRVLRKNMAYEKADEAGKRAIDEEVRQTLQLYNEAKLYNHDERLVERYVQKWKGGELKFSQGAEEMDMSFLAIKNNGERTLPRLTGEIHTLSEENVTKAMHELPELLAKAAREQDHAPLVELIRHVKEGMGSVHGVGAGTQVAMDLAILCNTYFKKDFNAINPALVALRGGRRKPHSFAAEIAGTSDRVWEWDNIDSYNFAMALEAADVLPRHAEDLAARSTKVVERKSKLTGRTIRKVEFAEDHSIKTSKDFRKAVGATNAGIVRDLAIKYGPLVAAGMAAFAIAMAMRAIQHEGKKR